MLRDITLGQYFPGNSPIHKMDPRVKILWTIFYCVILFTGDNFLDFALIGAFTFVILFITKIPIKYFLKGIKPILFFMIFTAFINAYMTPGEKIYDAFWAPTKEGLLIASLMATRLIFLVMGTTILTLTTSPIMLSNGIEKLLSPFKKIGVPAHEISMMMSIAIRFIPTLLEETDKIIKAQTARGADFEGGKLLDKAKALIPILVPLFISAFRRADELAIAMESRCYNGGDHRTSLKQLKIKKRDINSIIVATILLCVIVLLKYIV